MNSSVFTPEFPVDDALNWYPRRNGLFGFEHTMLQADFARATASRRLTVGSLRSLSLYVGYANGYALSKRPRCPSDRIESHGNILRVQQAI